MANQSQPNEAANFEGAKLANVASSETRAGGAGIARSRQSRPVKVADHYPVRRMTYLTITTKELKFLGFSSGIGSVALAFASFFAKEWMASDKPTGLLFVGAFGFAVVALSAYLYFGGLIAEIRRDSDLPGWEIPVVSNWMRNRKNVAR